MATSDPETRLDARFSSPGATPIDWPEAERVLRGTEIYWLTTVRADGRPHVTPLIGIWHDDAFWFCTGPEEQKARNLRYNARCAVTTGGNSLNDEGFDLVVEGESQRITDVPTLQRVADAYLTKYGQGWHFMVENGAFRNAGHEAWVYAIAPVKIFGFGRGETFSQTRWTPAQRS